MTARVIVLSTGGTIASRADDSGAAVPTDTAARLTAGLTPEGMHVEARDLLSTDSSALTLADLDTIRAGVAEALADPAVTGVVVTHGTDTMEETALLVDLGHADPRPVVFTGAQHRADDPQADGPANLAHALAVAADPAMQGHGVLLAFAGTVQTVRGVTKSSTDAPQPFSGGLPVPGPTPQRMLVASGPVAGLRVDVVASYPGADGTLLRAAVAAGADGVVLLATGNGNTTVELAAAVREAIESGVTVVVCSRVPTGAVDALYGGGGGALDLVDAGAIVSRRLRAGQARVALLALLAAGVGEQWIGAYFGV
ncbi:asparaginase [Tsukamurella soli]|uniref:asparaginase n=1 Tax=Tsukamurella soli TaxID=644556 RepID=A0ABP8K3A6_9ACTN